MNKTPSTKLRLAVRRTPLAAALVVVGAALHSPPASAFRFETEWFRGSLDSTLSYGVQRRMEGPDCRIVGNDNGGCVPTAGSPRIHDPAGLGPNPGYANPDAVAVNVDDGNLNFKKGRTVSAVLKGTHDLGLRFKDGWSALVRATWSSDMRGYKTDRTPLDDEAEDTLKWDATLLDAWVAKDFKIGEQSAKLKLGNQVISWGEDAFIFGGINTINAIDMRKFHIPGTQLKEVLIPAPMLSFSSGIGSGLSMEAYYQFRWNKLKLDPAGSYWSTADFVGKGGRNYFFPTSVVNDFFGAGLSTGTLGDVDPSIPGRDLASLQAAGTVIPMQRKEPKHSGQYGGALRYKGEGSDTEWSLYYIRYHDKIPFIGAKQICSTAVDPACLNPAAFATTALVEQYGEDRDLFGLGMNTSLGDWAVGAEVSYRPRDSVAVDPTVPFSGRFSLLEAAATNPDVEVMKNGYTEEKKWQAHLTGFYLLPQNVFSIFGASEGYFLGEVAATYYPKLDRSGRIPYALANYQLPDRTSFGYVAELGLTYANVFDSGWNMLPIIDFFHDVRGTSPNATPFVEGRKALSATLIFDLHSTWKVNLNYTTFWGGGGNNLLRDRDVLGASVSYSF